MTKQIKTSPLYNKKGRVIGGKLRTQSVQLSPYKYYLITITEVEEPSVKITKP